MRIMPLLTGGLGEGVRALRAAADSGAGGDFTPVWPIRGPRGAGITDALGAAAAWLFLRLRAPWGSRGGHYLHQSPPHLAAAVCSWDAEL